MSKHLPLRVIFGKSAPFHLPAFLNRFGVSPDMFQSLRLVEQPQVVNALIHEVFAVMLERNHGMLAKQVAKDLAVYRRHAKRTLKRKDMSEPEKSRWLLNKGLGNLEVVESRYLRSRVQEEMQRRATEIAVGAHLYWDPELEITRSTLIGCFAYDPDDNGVREDVVDICCKTCNHTEQEVDISMEWEDSLAEFEHISGPYFRCSDCDKVTRVELDRGNEYYYEPDDEAWSYYVDWLQEGLDAVAGHLQLHGLPAPAGLLAVGQGVDWRGRSGQFDCGFSGAELADNLRVNSPFSIHGGEIHAYPNGAAELRCTMYHHDVPTGAPFTIVPFYESEACGEHQIPAERMPEAAEFGLVYRELGHGLHRRHWAWWTKSGLEQVRYVTYSEVKELCDSITEFSFEQIQEVTEDDCAEDGLGFAIACLLEQLKIDSNFQGMDGSYNFGKMRIMASNINALMKCYYANRE